MSKHYAFQEIAACIASVEQLIKRSELLTKEYDEKIRSVDISIASEVSSLEHKITFPEVRSVDLLCKDALERLLPDHPELSRQWLVHKNVGIHSPEDLNADLSAKRSILTHALNLLRAKEGEKEDINWTRESVLPSSYQKLADPVRTFFEDIDRDCQNYDNNVFIMTRFQEGNKTLVTIDDNIRATLRNRGLVGHRADDRCYPSDRNLWDNVCTYMFCCKYGIAVLENIIVDEFNPNVALEFGFIRALGKPTLLLKENRFKPRADILGTIWNEFDILNIKDSIDKAINRWLDDLKILKPT